jgi:hypothetical protein
VPKGFLTENRTYEIELKLAETEADDDLILLVNDVPLAPSLRRYSLFFSFNLDFYAGNLRLAVCRGARILFIADLHVDPDRTKMTNSEFSMMVDELARSTASLYRLSSVTIPTPIGAVGTSTDIVTYELIRMNFDGFERAVNRIVDQPISALHSNNVETDIRSVRRVSSRHIFTALRSGRSREATAEEARIAPHLVKSLGGRWIPTITETRRVERSDILEHRIILGFMRWLDSRLAMIHKKMQGATSTSDSFAVLAFRLERIAQWRSKLGKLMRRDIFKGLHPESRMSATSIFRMQPNYAAAFVKMSRIRSGLGSGAFVPANISLDRTYQLYELWCYVGILLAVAERFPASRECIATILRGCDAPNQLGVLLARGNSAEVTLDDKFQLTYQRRISTKLSTDGVKSTAVDVIPDICISRRSASGMCEGLIVLDPKYRTGISLLDGIRDMHVYRDAIVDSKGGRLVKAAVALAPRFQTQSNSLLGLHLDKPGMLCLSPGNDPKKFDNVLRSSLTQLGHA